MCSKFSHTPDSCQAVKPRISQTNNRVEGMATSGSVSTDSLLEAMCWGLVVHGAQPKTVLFVDTRVATAKRAQDPRDDVTSCLVSCRPLCRAWPRSLLPFIWSYERVPMIGGFPLILLLFACSISLVLVRAVSSSASRAMILLFEPSVHIEISGCSLTQLPWFSLVRLKIP